MKLYAVFKEGVYRHECGGIFSTLEAAEKAALELINEEPDHHHTYEVVPFYLDSKTQTTGYEPGEHWSRFQLLEPDVIVVFERSRCGKVETKRYGK